MGTVTEHLLAEALQPRPGDAEAVATLLAATDPRAPLLEAPGTGEILWLRVNGVELRVIHTTPRAPVAVRPIVFVPGWGTNPTGWQDFYKAVCGKAELYYLETREKTSSRILERPTDMGVPQSARDVAAAILALGLSGKDYLLAGACWGAAIVLQGMIDGAVAAPTVIVGDPMHTLWFPKWLLRWVSPIVPTAALRLIRPILANALLGDMKEPTQKARALAFVGGADFWKWKKSAEAAKDFELYGSLERIRDEVFVLNGTADKVHDPVDYPLMCREMPRGRFLYMPTDEGHRELLFGVAATELARMRVSDGLAPSLARFERRVR